MTAYNRGSLIGESIESVLASSLEDFELIIVDDQSKDDTYQIAISYASRDPRIKVFRNETNLGDYVNRNLAASFARGKYLKYLDSDDLVYPFGLKAFVDSMEAHPEAGLGLCSSRINGSIPFPIVHEPGNAFRRHFFDYGILDRGPSGTIVRKDVFDELGGFSGARYIGDQELWLKIASRYPVLELNSTLIFWRQHEGQEFKLGHEKIDEGYFIMELPMLQQALSGTSSPLGPEESATILRRKRKEYSRRLVKHVLKTGEVSKALKSFGQLGLSVFDFF